MDFADRIGKGRDGFTEVVLQYQAPLLRYASRMLSNAGGADDVVQRTFIKCLLNWKGEMKPSEDLLHWLYHVAHNEAIDHIRREKRYRLLHRRHHDDPTISASGGTTADGEEIAPPERRAPEASDRARLAAEAMQVVLSEKERQLVSLKVYEEKSYKEIESITGFSVSNVGVTIHNAMRKLAEYLKRKGNGNEQE